MKFSLIILFFLFLGMAYGQENDGAAYQRNFESLVRQLAAAQRSAPLLGPPADVWSHLRMPPASSANGAAASYAASSASVKREGGEAKAVAYSSVEDVDREERLTDYSLEDLPKSGSTSDQWPGASKEDTDSTVTKPSPTYGPPYVMNYRQGDMIAKKEEEDSFSDVYFVAIVAGCCAVGIFGVISAGFCFYRLRRGRKAAADVDYPAYGVTGPSSKDVTSPNGDRKLAQSAQMYHYQHQKQQMIAVEKAGSTKNTSASDVDSEEENEEGDYTVYECPGLAPKGELEVKNPLFHDDSTPVSPPPAKTTEAPRQ